MSRWFRGRWTKAERRRIERFCGRKQPLVPTWKYRRKPKAAKLMERFSQLTICGAAWATLGFFSTPHAKGDSMCDALRSFAESIDDSETHEVFLRTDWGAEPAIACGRSEKRPEIAFCAYLVENSSIEFMAFNVQRVLECAGVDFPERSTFFIKSLKGTVISYDPAFTDKAIDMVVTFDTTSDNELPSLKISMSRRLEE